MPADRINKTKAFGRNIKLWIKRMSSDLKAFNIRTLSRFTLMARNYMGEKVWVFAEYPNNSLKQAFFLHGIHSTVFQAEVLAVSMAKNLLLEKTRNQSIVVLVYSQAAIKSLIKCTVTSITVQNIGFVPGRIFPICSTVQCIRLF